MHRSSPQATNTDIAEYPHQRVQVDVAGAAVSRTATDGVSFVPLIKGRSNLPRPELFWHYPHYWNGGKVLPYSVVRSGNWKLIRFYETGREEFYDFSSDISEQGDLAATNAETRKWLRARLDAWLGDVGAQMPVRK